jgi:hypothetical protein
LWLVGGIDSSYGRRGFVGLDPHEDLEIVMDLTALLAETIVTPSGTVEVALFRVTEHGVTRYEISVRDSRPLGFNSFIGRWCTLRTLADESAARAEFGRWLAIELRWAGIAS